MKIWILIIFSVFLVVDYRLWVTGNPSILFVVFGGWFLVYFIFAFIILGLVLSDSSASGKKKVSLVATPLFVGLVFYLSTDFLTDLSSEKADRLICEFLLDPIDSHIELNEEHLYEIMTNNFSCEHIVESGIFIPTARRKSYVLENDDGVKYRLILTNKSPLKSRMFLRRLKED